MKNARLLALFSLAGVFTLSGCATTPKVDPQARSHYDRTQNALKNKPVGIVADGCLVRVEVGKDDIMYQQSGLTAKAFANTVSTRLAAKGVQVSAIRLPFVCGALTKDKLLAMDILTTADAKDQRNTAYPILTADNNYDAATNTAYLNLYAAITQVARVADNTTGQYTPLNLDATSLATIQQSVNADKAFVAMVTGKKPSFGASMAVGAATVLASGGMMGYTLQEGQHYSIYLVDLANNQIQWAQNGDIKGQVFKMPVSETFEQPKLFYPLYDD